VGQERSQGVVSRQLFLSLYLPATLLSLGDSMVAPVIPVFTKSFEVSFATASLVFVVMSVGSLVGAFSAGYLMDKIGRRPVLLASPILVAIGSLMTPFSGSFEMLLLWRFLVGAAHHAWQQARVVIIADTAHHRERARQMQWMSGVSRAGQLFGPAAGGLMAGGFGLWVPFVVHAVLTVASVVPSFKLIQETAPGLRGRDSPEEAELARQGWRPVIAYMLTFQIIFFLCIQLAAAMCRGGQEHGALNLYAVYAYDLGPQELGLLNTVAVILGVPVPFLSGYFMDRYGRRSVIVPGFGSYGLSVVLMSLTAFLPLPVTFFLACYVLTLATQGTTGGTMQVLGADLAPPFGRGRYFAIWRPVSQLGSTVTPGLFALIAERAGYGYGFLYLSACAFFVAIGVGTILGDTLAQHDREDAQRMAVRRSARDAE